MWFKNSDCQDRGKGLINSPTVKCKLQDWDKNPQVLELETSVGKGGYIPCSSVNAVGTRWASNFKKVQANSGAESATLLAEQWTSVNSRLNWESLPWRTVESNQEDSHHVSLGVPQEWPYTHTHAHTCTNADMNTCHKHRKWESSGPIYGVWFQVWRTQENTIWAAHHTSLRKETNHQWGAVFSTSLSIAVLATPGRVSRFNLTPKIPGKRLMRDFLSQDVNLPAIQLKVSPATGVLDQKCFKF